MKLPNLISLLALGSLAPARPEPDTAIMAALANLVLLAAASSGRSPLELDEHVQRLIASGYPLTVLKVQRLHDAVASGELGVDQLLAVLPKLAQTSLRGSSIDDAIEAVAGEAGTELMPYQRRWMEDADRARAPVGKTGAAEVERIERAMEAARIEHRRAREEIDQIKIERQAKPSRPDTFAARARRISRW